MLSTLLLAFPEIDPVALEVGPLVIRWYALAYLAGIVIGWWLLMKLNARRSLAFPTPLLSKAALDDIVLYATLGIILGGRFGYVLFYDFAYYAANPLQAFALWHGGMSFHGGLLGMLSAMGIFCWRHNVRWLPLMDLLAVCAPIGIFFGRAANFINGELYGRVAVDVSWAMVFPHGGPAPRHPSQLYEAGLEGLLLLAILLVLALRTQLRDKVGALSGVFLLGYGSARAFVEFFREPDAQLGYLTFGLTMGQLLCLPMILGGLGLLVWALRRPVVAQTSVAGE
jgi:phosphatidylglycerol:prolipoprotein diacylglycerol transferase